MPDRDKVLFANEAFYAAFAAADAAAMDDVWAHQTGVSCTHPGWAPIRGRGPVMDSWRAIFGGQGAVAIDCRDAHAEVSGATAVVTCLETLGETVLAATNVFVVAEGRWRMIHHQAGPVAGQTAPPAGETPTPRPN